MDAMDITNLPSPPPERESKVIKDEYIEETVDSVSNEDVDVSFEDLMCSMFDEVMNRKDVYVDDDLANLNVEAEVLLSGEITVDEDVDFLIETKGKEILNNEIKDEKSFLPLVEEDFVVQEEDIPVIECELELSSTKIKDKKEAKNVKEELIEEKSEEKEEVADVFPKEEHRHVAPLVKENVDNAQKIELKDEEKDDVELVDNLIAQKPKKQIKKLNISVEDLRTATEAQVEHGSISMEEGQSSSFDGQLSYNDSKDISSSHSTSSGQKAEMNESANSTQFSSILAEQIKANSAELVQRGKIVLRDGNVGEIRLQLKPAHLGVVRINLKMTGDKKMQGEVTVSSKEAYDAFENSMEDLVSSFKDAGFDTSGFNLNWKDGREEIVREDLRDKYFSPEKTVLALRENLNVTENIYKFGQAENVNVLA